MLFSTCCINDAVAREDQLQLLFFYKIFEEVKLLFLAPTVGLLLTVWSLAPDGHERIPSLPAVTILPVAASLKKSRVKGRKIPSRWTTYDREGEVYGQSLLHEDLSCHSDVASESFVGISWTCHQTSIWKISYVPANGLIFGLDA